MCVVSAIYDYGRQNHIEWTPEVRNQWLQLVEAARVFDHVAGQPDCEDPEKAKFLQAIEQQVQPETKE